MNDLVKIDVICPNCGADVEIFQNAYDIFQSEDFGIKRLVKTHPAVCSKCRTPLVLRRYYQMTNYSIERV